MPCKLYPVRCDMIKQVDPLSSKLSIFRKTFGRKQIRHGNEIWEYFTGAQAKLQLDYHLQKITGDLPPIPTLLFETGRDGFVSRRKPLFLRARYPKARICRFEDGGHLE